MARADLLVELVKAGSRGDLPMLRQVVDALVREERAKQHHVLADRLAAVLPTSNGAVRPGMTRLDDRTRSMLFELMPRRSLSDLILPPRVELALRELVEEQHRRELLR